MNIRIGHGYDVHRFDSEQSSTDDCFVVLGGIKIPHTHNLLAHSDGDVLIHALCDALLGGIGEGDIGRHFPDTDDSYKNISSVLLLQKVMDLVSANGWQVANADMTVIAQAPKLAPYIDVMQEKLSKSLSIDNKCINIKATTSEGLGFVGRQEGIACHAVILLAKR